jgi:hypothetical protein
MQQIEEPMLPVTIHAVLRAISAAPALEGCGATEAISV